MCRPKPDVAIPVWEEKLGWNDPLRVGTRRPTQRKDHVQARRAVGALERERSGPPTPLSGVGGGTFTQLGSTHHSVERLWNYYGADAEGKQLEDSTKGSNWKLTLRHI